MDEPHPCLLLIDDDADDRALAHLVVKDRIADVEVQEVRDALELAQACARRDFDVVVLELRLAWADGLAVLAFLKEEWPEIPVLVFTRHGGEEASARAIKLGACQYLPKSAGSFLRLPQEIETALAQSRGRRRPRRGERLESLLGDARIGVFSAGMDGRLLNANPAFLRMLGVDTLEAADRLDLAPLVALDSGEAAGAAREVRLVRADGRPIWVQAMRTLHREPGAPARVDGLAEDVTARRRSAEELDRRAARLERANEELQRFASLASHELQEPARTIERYGRMLQEDSAGRLDAEGERLLGQMVAGARRLQDLAEDLLALARLEARPARREEVDSQALLAQALAGLAALLDESGALVTHGPLPRIHADPTEVVLLFQNLVSNAVKYRGAEPPRVVISAARADGHWVFSVVDNGAGIDPAETESIFLPFKRLRPEVPGTGLGLDTCRRIVERHGGRIWATSEPGQGSTFHFTIPAPEGEEKPSRVSARHQPMVD